MSANRRRYAAKKIQPIGFVLILYGHGILSYGHGKVMEFCHGNFVATLQERCLVIMLKTDTCMYAWSVGILVCHRM